MYFRNPLALILLLYLSVVGNGGALAAESRDLSKARSLLMHGRYEEAADLYRPEAAQSSAAALGLAACLESQGKFDAAMKTLDGFSKKDAPIQAELARMAFDRGDWQEAESRAKATIALSAEQPLARFVLAELSRVAGQTKEAERGYQRLISFYNNHDVKKAESLHWYGRAAAQYARWNRLSDQFDFLVNDLYPSALKLDRNFWPAHYEAGLLFMEKFNHADATKEFQSALEINPRAAEVHAALAALALEEYRIDEAERLLRRALEINPRLLVAWRLKAEMAWFHGRTNEALQILKEKALPLNPRDEETLARIAACYLELDPADSKSATNRFEPLVKEVLQRNPRPGEFYAAMAEMFEIRNKQAATDRYFREAIRVMPQLPAPHAGLGLLYMRTGQEADARKVLQAAFDADAFHVRVKNSLDVLDVVDGMQTKSTPHFVIKYMEADKVLIRYLSPHLESVYQELKEEFGYEPPGPTLIEVFNEARGQTGHTWFSARMIGMPYLGTVAASTGRIVAVASPSETKVHRSYNWARTLKHEMVHVFNLQQTGYNIPHWFTEGLAVYNEKVERPHEWNLILRRRAADHKLFDLDTINIGFARPMDGDDCQLAYCQSELLVEYMLARGKAEVLTKMLAAYAANPSTAAAIEQVFGVPQSEFERGYREFLSKQIASTPVLPTIDADEFDELLAAYRTKRDALVAGRLAAAYLHRGAKREAEEMAREALGLQPKQPHAVYVLARLQKLGTALETIKRLEESLDRKTPEPLVLSLLGSLKLKAEKFDEAADLYALGERSDPTNPRWTALRARVYLMASKKPALVEALARLAKADADDFVSRKKLAELALDCRDAAAARRWAAEALEIQVDDADAHRLLAEALVELGELPRAIEEFELAVELNPANSQQRLSLADALIQAKQPKKAKKVLEELLRRDPKQAAAAVLLESLKKDP